MWPRQALSSWFSCSFLGPHTQIWSPLKPKVISKGSAPLLVSTVWTAQDSLYSSSGVLYFLQYSDSLLHPLSTTPLCWKFFYHCYRPVSPGSFASTDCDTNLPFEVKVISIFLSHRLPRTFCHPWFGWRMHRNLELQAMKNSLEWIIKSKPELVGFLCLA